MAFATKKTRIPPVRFQRDVSAFRDRFQTWQDGTAAAACVAHVNKDSKPFKRYFLESEGEIRQEACALSGKYPANKADARERRLEKSATGYWALKETTEYCALAGAGAVIGCLLADYFSVNRSELIIYMGRVFFGVAALFGIISWIANIIEKARTNAHSVFSDANKTMRELIRPIADGKSLRLFFEECQNIDPAPHIKYVFENALEIIRPEIRVKGEPTSVEPMPELDGAEEIGFVESNSGTGTTRQLVANI